MSDFDRGKFYGKKKFQTPKDLNNYGRTYFSGNRNDTKESKSETIPKKPMILIKREKEPEEVAQSPKRTKDVEIETPLQPQVKQMIKSVKFMEDLVLCPENLQDFVEENPDFIVVAVIGMQGVGKSTILNLIGQDEVRPELFGGGTESKSDESEIFKIQTTEDVENNAACTRGIDIFITKDKLVLLDCQPFNSVGILDELVQSDKRTSLINEFSQLENNGEIQALQITAFLMSICHILIVVQDWFFDSNVVRFVQSAEMLKPTHYNPEDEQNDYFPHLILVQNRALIEDFSPKKFDKIQEIYSTLFAKTKLGKNSGLGLTSNRITSHLNDSCKAIFNVFLIPEYDLNSSVIYRGYPPFEELIRKLQTNIFGINSRSLTHVELTEKTWLVYCSKVWENVKKSSFFVEYAKLMP